MGDPDRAPEHSGLFRFFVEPAAATEERISFSGEQQAQIRRVLRLRTGDRLVVCDGSGDEILATAEVSGREVWARPVARRPGMAEPARQVVLYQSALRGDRFTWLLQKGTEIGVAAFVPVRFHFTQPAAYEQRLQRYRTVALEAAEQSGRARAPEVRPLRPFDRALAEATAQEGASVYLLDERETSISLRAALDGAGSIVGIFAGPEGGLTGAERSAALAAGALPVRLGPLVLRSETAGLVAAVLALAASGDLG